LNGRLSTRLPIVDRRLPVVPVDLVPAKDVGHVVAGAAELGPML